MRERPLQTLPAESSDPAKIETPAVITEKEAKMMSVDELKDTLNKINRASDILSAKIRSLEAEMNQPGNEKSSHFPSDREKAYTEASQELKSLRSMHSTLDWVLERKQKGILE